MPEHSRPDGSALPAPALFSARSEFALKAARNWASRMRHDHVASEHILLGLIATIPEAFSALSLSADRVQSAVEQVVRIGRTEMDPAAAPYTSRTQELLEIAGRNAEATGSSKIQPEHLLLACVQTDRTLSQEVLVHRLGVSPQIAVETLLPLLQQRRDRGPGGGSAD